MDNLSYGSDAELLQEYQQNQNLPRWQLDLSSEMWKLRLSLQGLIVNPKYAIKQPNGEVSYEEYVEVPGAKMVNHQGAVAIFNKLSAELTKVLMDTKWDERIISSELIAFEYDFPLWLLLRSQDFSLSSKDYDTICEMAIRLVKSAMYRSVGGWKGDLINAPGNVREVFHQGQEEQPRKRFGFFGN